METIIGKDLLNMFIEETIISKPDDIVKNKLMSENSWFHHDQEVYVYSKEIRTLPE